MISGEYKEKIRTVEELAEIIGQPPRKRKVIMCHGTFDVVHPGHVRHLIYAKQQADILVASLTTDDYIEKAHFRPFVPEALRAMNLAALHAVDYVLIDRNRTPLENLQILKPDYFAKGYEYTEGGLHPKTAEEKAVLDAYGGEIIFTPGDVVYSSSKLIEESPPNLAVDKVLSLFEAEGLAFDDLRRALEEMGRFEIHVVGDTIVDTLTETTMIGGQSKTPTISVRNESQHHFVGGAGIVAKHLRAAGAKVSFTTLLGDDQWKEFVLDDLEAAGVEVNAIVDHSRPTTHKNAIVCENTRLLKIDTVDNRVITGSIFERFSQAVEATKGDAIVFADFRHGIFNHDTIPTLAAAIPSGLFKVADSQVASRWGNITEFQNFDLITPNEREARFALGDQDSVIRPLARRLFEASNCRNLILKLGRRGLLCYRSRNDLDDLRSFFALDSFAERVVDAVGAGDALLAYATLSHLAGGNPVIAAVLGAMAAAAECEVNGNVPISPEDVRQRIQRLQAQANFQLIADERDKDGQSASRGA